MKDIFNEMQEWADQGKRFAVATVVNTWRSSPRPVGSSLIVSEDSEMVGSVSGGCVENSVVQKALQKMQNDSSELAKYGVKNEDAWVVGLSCGGKIDILIEPFYSGEKKLNDQWEDFRNALNNNQGAVLIYSLLPDTNFPSLYLEEGGFSSELTEEVKNKVVEAFNSGKSQTFQVGENEYFAHVFPPKNRMLIIGSAHITTELIQLAGMYDFETIVIDPRDTFATKTHYNVAPDQLLINWPQEVMNDMPLDKYTYAVILSHDPKIDDEALAILLNKDVSYIGALGSKRTHEKRVMRLKERGFSEEQLEKIHAPVGIKINAQIPNEIALSVMSEIIQAKNS